MPRLVVIKVGGSALTHKGQFETLRENVLDTWSSNIASALKANTSLRLVRKEASRGGFCILICVDTHIACVCKQVIVHGAGSFGHFQAHKYKVRRAAADINVMLVVTRC